MSKDHSTASALIELSSDDLEATHGGFSNFCTLAGIVATVAFAELGPLAAGGGFGVALLCDAGEKLFP
jgi:hypothetical protein